MTQESVGIGNVAMANMPVAHRSKLDFVLIQLKVIAETPRHRRLCMTADGGLTVESDRLWTPLKRTLYGDCRSKLVRDLTFLLNEIGNQSRILMEADEDGPTNLASLYRELCHSVQGFESLKTTYNDDKWMLGELDLIEDKVKKFIGDIAGRLDQYGGTERHALSTRGRATF